MQVFFFIYIKMQMQMEAIFRENMSHYVLRSFPPQCPLVSAGPIASHSALVKRKQWVLAISLGAKTCRGVFFFLTVWEFHWNILGTAMVKSTECLLCSSHQHKDDGTSLCICYIQHKADLCWAAGAGSTHSPLCGGAFSGCN